MEPVPAVLLTLAIVVEVVSTALLPRTVGFTRPGWTVAVVSGYAVALWLLALVVRTMPVSVAYAVWAGLGTALVAIVGVVFLSEPLGWIRAASLGMIVVGVVGLNLSGAH
ncbi:Quaternary ammonium compound-resistance protein QacC [Nocardioides dokdonensis FR1436]|uniref:Quaternary ammonium compound-resistance protein QacC n=1 Tax=Nocardioides dokdonensis FR1436 TaxID=1300347 RepID=A0A1A9GKE6_9ACTN|nr:Quaternary ammonium compound-resistance protein QacC [Nocardioides dokdonensis FR1436]